MRHAWPIVPCSLIVVVALSSCAGRKAEPAKGPASPVTAPDPLAAIDRAEDGRSYGPQLSALADFQDADIRSRLALALGRIGDPRGCREVQRLLGDEVAKVRLDAAFAAALLAGAPCPELRSAIASRLASPESSQEVRALLFAEGRLGKDLDGRSLAPFLGDPRPEVRAAALHALGLAGASGYEADGALAARTTSLLEDKSQEVRFYAAFALARLKAKADPAEPCPAALARAAGSDSSAAVRAMAVRALTRRCGAARAELVARLEDKEPAVAAAAAQALVGLPAADRCPLAGAAIAGAAAHLRRAPLDAWGAYAHIARAALESGLRCKLTGADAEAAKSCGLAVEGAKQPLSAGAARIRCLSRALAPAEDLSLVACDPKGSTLGQVLLSQRLGDRAATDPEAVSVLAEMSRSSDLQVAVTAVAALSASQRKGAVDAVFSRLEDGETIVAASALDSIAEHAEALTAPQPGGLGLSRSELLSRVQRAVDRFDGVDSAASVLISAAAAARALCGDDGRAASPVLDRLARDVRPSVRAAALEAIASLPGLSTPLGLPPLEPVRPVSHEAKVEARSRATSVWVRTSRGEIAIALRPDLAPATVSSFLELMRGGYFKDTPIHRVVPGFVVQAGDPTGTGLGDPGYDLRCELTPEPYERGTVGMALSGKDTGGSQFFIALSRQPHLDGAYTVFGRVVEGMEIADLLEEGDSILDISEAAVEASGSVR